MKRDNLELIEKEATRIVRKVKGWAVEDFEEETEADYFDDDWVDQTVDIRLPENETRHEPWMDSVDSRIKFYQDLMYFEEGIKDIFEDIVRRQVDVSDILNTPSDSDMIDSLIREYMGYKAQVVGHNIMARQFRAYECDQYKKVHLSKRNIPADMPEDVTKKLLDAMKEYNDLLGPINENVRKQNEFFHSKATDHSWKSIKAEEIETTCLLKIFKAMYGISDEKINEDILGEMPYDYFYYDQPDTRRKVEGIMRKAIDSDMDLESLDDNVINEISEVFDIKKEVVKLKPYYDCIIELVKGGLLEDLRGK